MVKTVDKFSIENRADEEIKFAVENVIRHEYDNAVNHIKRALGMLKSIGCMEKYVEYLNILGLVYELDNKE
ncbi:tetratricopeptide repeat protein, partial [[Eubacterium] rectale]|nr:tetratricopeptide repeat protein [Agathobacter rectalis]